MSRRRGWVAVAAVAALAVAGCGGSSSRSGSPQPPNTVPSSPAALKISPAHPVTTDPVSFAFTAPQATGVHGKSRISYSVSITGPAGKGCAGAKEASTSQAGKGGTAAVTVGPTQLGSPWCIGSYTARAFELQSAACKGSAPCPQYIRVVGIVARATFSVGSS